MAEEKDASSSKDSQSTNASRVEWDDSKMVTTYANVANAASTREEVALLFGTNTTWKVTGGKPVKIELNNRIILSPYAAKRLNLLLASVLGEYESRFGKLDVEPPEKGGGK